MSETIPLGIVGFGRIVELIHLPLLKQLPRIEVAGVFDVTPQRLALAAKRGFDIFERLEDLLSSPAEAVLIATPPNSHFRLAEQALRSGKHVLIEKPVTLSSEEAVRLQTIAEQEGKIVSVFHNRRFDSDFLLVKQMINEEALGSILFVERRHHMFGSGASFGVKSFHQEWRNEKAYGGGALLDWGIHLIDQLLQLDFGRCVDINASMKTLSWEQGEVDDYVRATFTTERNVVMSMDINFASNVPAPLWVVGGDKATLQIVSEREASVHVKGKPTQPIMLEPSLNKGAIRIYSSFADSVRYGAKPEVTLEEAIEAMKIVEWIRLSSLNRQEMENGNLICRPAVRV
ncbi:Gfo/Idh/MocA family protein [Cohnella cholangitidis]|uniref:Gfo/Idh/MocA family oxidoreductase n=1 Tax=Cohnella cholangitidis TaxID=2598458 RepID=A0A7G5BUH8_9BACL|nr:Gfo/Idh/MocA family oxidoreductase [Cohnella cholangitidis]QMV40612.1 Gfo/Idh/MocA family oxidoreductase [Cohnella cholangitidis]